MSLVSQLSSQSARVKLIGHILVIVDNPDRCFSMQRVLSLEGHQIYDLCSTLLLIQHLDQLDIEALPDVIIIDIMVSQMQGIEVCRQIKADTRWHNISVLLMTVSMGDSPRLGAWEVVKSHSAHYQCPDTESLAALCLDAGADDIIDRPIYPWELRSRLQTLLRLKHQAEQIQQQEALLQRRQDMTDMVIHDLRTPVARLKIACEVLLKTELAAKQQKKIMQINNSGQQLELLIDSLLLTAQMEAHSLVLHPQRLDVYALLNEVIADCQITAIARNIDLKLQGSYGEVWIEADQLLLRRILENLVDNAIKFSPLGSGVQIMIEPYGLQQVQIQIIDQGSGISARLMPHVFTKYATEVPQNNARIANAPVETALKSIPQVGLGLAFCKLATEAHGGKITVQPNFPHGSIFTLII